MVKLELFYSPVCPHCPKALRLTSEVAGRYPQVAFVEVDTYTEEGIERGMSVGVMAVPTVALNDEIKLVGWPFEEKDLVSLIESGL
jgi:small redox-active disulfide protein 1